MHTDLLFGIHCHQPVDNFSHVVDEAIQYAYYPFFKTLRNHKEIFVNVHFSGWLLEYIRQNAPELFELLQKCSGQIEFFTGGFYEPVLPSIPSKDRRGQIQMLSDYIQKHFGQDPKGIWLTERVWQSSLITDLTHCGIQYAIIDDYHLQTIGMDPVECRGFFTSEDNGRTIALFPISKKLRYQIPFADVEDVMQTLGSYRENPGHNAAVIFDDGEKFGIWPGTYERVYEQGWLESFFEQIAASSDVDTQSFADYFHNNKPLDNRYIEESSYKEMSQWSLPAKDFEAYEKAAAMFENVAVVKGGKWKNFLNKYQESNWLHKRMLQFSRKNIKDKAFTQALYKAQCNDVFWHGIFGGIYLPNLRDNAYRYLLQCQNIAAPEAGVYKSDITMDGYEELCFYARDISMIISPKNGGQIFELALTDKLFNLQNTMTRYKEGYHNKIESVADTGDSQQGKTIHENLLQTTQDLALYYDWHYKKSNIDHITDREFCIDSFEKNSFKEYGDFANQPFDCEQTTENSAALRRQGGIYHHNTKTEAAVAKQYTLKEGTLALKTRLESQNTRKLLYVNEWNLHFADMQQVYFERSSLDASLHIFSKNVQITDLYTQKRIVFTCDDRLDIYIVPMKTISQNESGIDYTIQGVSIAFITPFGKNCDFALQMRIHNL